MPSMADLRLLKFSLMVVAEITSPLEKEFTVPDTVTASKTELVIPMVMPTPNQNPLLNAPHCMDEIETLVGCTAKYFFEEPKIY